MEYFESKDVSFDDVEEDVVYDFSAQGSPLKNEHLEALKAYLAKAKADEDQLAVINAPCDGVYAVSAGAGAGKELRNGTLIATIEGFTKIEDLSPGDLVASSDGKFYPVTGVFPQGVKDVYEVAFSDGVKEYAGKDHLWKCISQSDLDSNRHIYEQDYTSVPYGVKSTSDFIDSFDRERWLIPYTQPVQYPEKNLPIHPYVLGIFLSCGAGYKTPSIKSTDRFQLTGNQSSYLLSLMPFEQKEDFSLEHKFLGLNMRLPGLRQSLEQLSLDRVSKRKRFIPTEYLTASLSQRKQLFHAIQTVTCSHSDDAGSNLVVESLPLAQGIASLARSFGWSATLAYFVVKEKTFWMVSVSYTLSQDLVPTKGHKAFCREIKFIKFIGKFPCTCISIDSPDHTFLTENYVVTHNTTTLINRAIKLISKDRIHPSRLVLITYTNKAANEIRERYESVWRNNIPEFSNKSVKPPMPYIGTIHSFSYWILIYSGLNSIKIMDELPATNLLGKVLQARFPMRPNLYDKGFVKDLYSIFLEMASNSEIHYCAIPKISTKTHSVEVITPEQARSDYGMANALHYLNQTSYSFTQDLVMGEPNPSEADVEKRTTSFYCSRTPLTQSEFKSVYKEFLTQKYKANTLEFVDMIHLALHALLQIPVVLDFIQKKYSHYFEDEAQDTDTVLFALLRLCAGVKPNQWYCADTRQTLYFWRWARPDIVDYLDRVYNFKFTMPSGEQSVPSDTKFLSLRYNYRSPRQLVLLSNYFADLFTNKKYDAAIPFLPKADKALTIKSFDTILSERSAISVEIRRLHDEQKVKYSDIAILSRNNRQLLDLESVMIARRIPYRVKYDNRSAVKQSTFKLLASFYEFLSNPGNLISSFDLLTYVKSLGTKTILQIVTRARELQASGSLLSLLDLRPEHFGDKKLSKALTNFFTFRDKILKPLSDSFNSSELTFSQINRSIESILVNNCIFEEDLKNATENDLVLQVSKESLLKNLKLMLSIYTSMLEDYNFSSLGIKQRLRAIGDLVSIGSSSGEDPSDMKSSKKEKSTGDDCVTLATIHSYKGREADYVYLTNVNTLSPTQPSEIHSERCCFYVAVTRAKKHLTICESKMGTDYAGKLKPTVPSMFLLEYKRSIEKLKKEL